MYNHTNSLKRTRRFLLEVVPVTLLLATAACVPKGPINSVPKAPTPDRWINGPTTDAITRPDTGSGWDAIRDSSLDALIREARQNSPDVLTAVARLDEADARARMTAGDRWPGLTATGSFNRSQSSGNGFGSDLTRDFYNSRITDNLFETGLSASWELDLFGRVRSRVKEAAAAFHATAADLRGARLSLSVRVAESWADLRTVDHLLALARERVRVTQTLLDQTQARFDAGMVPESDAHAIRQILADASSEVARLNVRREAALNRLAVLLGRKPGSLSLPSSSEALLHGEDASVPVTVPADVLRQRPDVNRAEQLLLAQIARSSLVRAERYPSISLSGMIGFQSTRTATLFDSGSRIFSLGPSIRWNLFAGGRLKAAVDAEDAVTRQRVQSWRHTVLNAIAEVETALKQLSEDTQLVRQAKAAATAARKSWEIDAAQADAGLVSPSVALQNRMTALTREAALVETRFNRFRDHLNLLMALGVDWAEPRHDTPGLPSVPNQTQSNSGDA